MDSAYTAPTLRGKLIILEPLCIEKHAKGYFEVCQDENIHKFTGNTIPKDPGEIEILLSKYRQFFINWMILERESGRVIGILRLGKPCMKDGKLIAGESQFLASKYWRKGHMKEAKKLFYQYVFHTLAVDMLVADVWEGNENSMRSLAYYGYKPAGKQISLFSKTGTYIPQYIYTLTKEDYLAKTEETKESC